jgi:hypothetical protein
LPKTQSADSSTALCARNDGCGSAPRNQPRFIAALLFPIAGKK